MNEKRFETLKQVKAYAAMHMLMNNIVMVGDANEARKFLAREGFSHSFFNRVHLLTPHTTRIVDVEEPVLFYTSGCGGVRKDLLEPLERRALRKVYDESFVTDLPMNWFLIDTSKRLTSLTTEVDF